MKKLLLGFVLLAACTAYGSPTLFYVTKTPSGCDWTLRNITKSAGQTMLTTKECPSLAAWNIESRKVYFPEGNSIVEADWPTGKSAILPPIKVSKLLNLWIDKSTNRPRIYYTFGKQGQFGESEAAIDELQSDRKWKRLGSGTGRHRDSGDFEQESLKSLRSESAKNFCLSCMDEPSPRVSPTRIVASDKNLGPIKSADGPSRIGAAKNCEPIWKHCDQTDPKRDYIDCQMDVPCNDIADENLEVLSVSAKESFVVRRYDGCTHEHFASPAIFCWDDCKKRVAVPFAEKGDIGAVKIKDGYILLADSSRITVLRFGVTKPILEESASAAFWWP